MTAVIHKISVGAGGKHILSPEESLSRIDRARIRVPLRRRRQTAIKNEYSNVSFSSVTAATESLGLSDNGFKTA